MDSLLWSPFNKFSYAGATCWSILSPSSSRSSLKQFPPPWNLVLCKLSKNQVKLMFCLYRNSIVYSKMVLLSYILSITFYHSFSSKKSFNITHFRACILSFSLSKTYILISKFYFFFLTLGTCVSTIQ